jgi:hypothetical protein
MVLTQIFVLWIFVIQIFGLLFDILNFHISTKVNYSDSVAMLVDRLTIYQMCMFEHWLLFIGFLILQSSSLNVTIVAYMNWATCD